MDLILEKTFSEIFPDKNRWFELSYDERKDLADELYKLVDIAYQTLGGHVRIVSPDSIIFDKDLTFWIAANIDDDPFADLTIFGRKTKHGIKISGWGHDGNKESKNKVIDILAEILNRKGYFIEVSGRPAELLVKQRHLNYLFSKKQVQNIFPHTNITWYGIHPSGKYNGIKGFYSRTLEDGSETDIEILIGNPL
jgi:hypothetical protein